MNVSACPVPGSFRRNSHFRISLLLAAVAGLRAVAADYDTGLWFGTIRPPLAPPTGEVVDRIFVGDNFKGLTFANQDLLGQGTTPTLFYSVRHDAVSGAAFLDTIATPVAPHTALPAVVDRFGIGSFDYKALTFAAPDVGFGPTQLYSLRGDVAAPQFGTIKASGAFQDRFAVGVGYDSLTFSATDVTFGANLFYYLRHDAGGTHFGTIDPALPGMLADRWTLSKDNFDALVFVSTDVGYGADLFYYIRHDGTTRQSEFGTIDPLTGVAVDRFAIGSTADAFHELTFTTTDVGYGANEFYYLRNSILDVPEAGGFAAVGVCGGLLAAWQWLAVRRRAGA